METFTFKNLGNIGNIHLQKFRNKTQIWRHFPGEIWEQIKMETFNYRNLGTRHKYGNISPVPKGKLRQGAQFKLDWEQPTLPGMGHPHLHSKEFLPNIQPEAQI